jgi:hypothetical protein
MNVRRIQHYLERKLKFENDQMKVRKEWECSLEQLSVSLFVSLFVSLNA